MSRPDAVAGVVVAAVVAGLLLAPRYAEAYAISLLINILMYVALATAWALFSGPTRYVSLAASAFFGTGAYAVAVLGEPYGYGVAVAAAVGCGGALALLVGLATLRRRGIYFVIFTFGLAELRYEWRELPPGLDVAEVFPDERGSSSR